jgi:RNA polymerase sigma-70 factor, ECF subfamily
MTMTTEVSDGSSAQREASSSPLWTELVDKIRQNDATGMEELYRVFSRGVRYYFCRHLGSQDLDDKVHDTFLVVAQAIQRGGLREPERLMGYVRTVVRRRVAAQIEDNVHRRAHHDLDWGLAVHDADSNPEERAMQEETQEIALKVLKGMAPRNREILIRFYLQEQPADQICREMGLTETQFRLLKSRAKARFGELGKRKVTINAPAPPPRAGRSLGFQSATGAPAIHAGTPSASPEGDLFAAVAARAISPQTSPPLRFPPQDNS